MANAIPADIPNSLKVRQSGVTCQTSKGSPRTKAVTALINELRGADDGRLCQQTNDGNSMCRTLAKRNGAAIGICGGVDADGGHECAELAGFASQIQQACVDQNGFVGDPNVLPLMRPLVKFPSSCAYPVLTTVAGRSFLAFLLAYLLLIYLCNHAFYRDPTSAFFDPARAYKHTYSTHRQGQADEFIKATELSLAKNDNSLRETKASLCLGIATVERPGEQYLRYTLGSLLEGLTDEERHTMHVAILIGHTRPENHSIYYQPWLTALSNQILTYNISDAKQFNLLTEWEQDKDYRRKAIYDYTYLLETCIRTGATHIAMIEDDVLAVQGWYARTSAALGLIKAKSVDWLYLRLFFTEQFFGWNSEFWPTYLLASICVVAAVATLLVALRTLCFHSSLPPQMIFLASLVYTPACILLYFMAGRVSLRPMAPGVHEMPDFGCCAQGFVFPAAIAPRVVDKLKEKEQGFVDMIIEEWAKEEAMKRFAVIPSLLQHIGSHSSKGDDIGPTQPMSVAETIFNFGFERYEQRGDRVTHPSIDE
ncbi:MAG: hypothetical protein Q9219_000524 [cf. Caloplaca sp. 3 TL-2023]